MILSSAYPELVIPNKSLHEYMLENFKSYPSNKPALVSFQTVLFDNDVLIIVLSYNF